MFHSLKQDGHRRYDIAIVEDAGKNLARITTIVRADEITDSGDQCSVLRWQHSGLHLGKWKSAIGSLARKFQRDFHAASLPLGGAA